MKRLNTLPFIGYLAIFLFLFFSENAFAAYNITAGIMNGSDGSTALPVGNILQIIDPGTNRTIDSMGIGGTPGGDDSLISTHTVGENTSEEGWSYLVIDGDNETKSVFLRSFNAKTLGTATKYGNSGILSIAPNKVPAPPDDYSTDNFNVTLDPLGTSNGTITGAIIYGNYTTGSINVIAATDADMNNVVVEVVFSAPGFDGGGFTYTLSDVPIGTYYVGAYHDTNNNSIMDQTEAKGRADNTSNVTSGGTTSGTDITLQDPIAAPTFTPGTDVYSTGPSVTINEQTGAATTYYTLDGSQPNDGDTLYEGSVTVGASAAHNDVITLTAISYDSNGYPGVSSSAVYTFDRQIPTDPSLSLGTGIYNIGQNVTLTPADEAVNSTYYTIDGSTPSNTGNGTLYTGPIAIDGNDTVVKTLRIVSYDAVGNASNVITATYTFDKQGPTAPTLDIETGFYNGDQTVTPGGLTVDHANTYYTLGATGTEPDNTSTAYTSGAISVTGNDGDKIILKIISYDSLGNKGLVTTATYTFDKVGPTAPTLDIETGFYNGDQTVTLGGLTVDHANTYYTLGATGTEPDSGSTAYTTGIINVTGGNGDIIILKIVSYDSSGNKGLVTTATYTFVDPLVITGDPIGNALQSATTNNYGFTGGTGKVAWIATAGTIDAFGLFTAPTVTSGSQAVIITATDSHSGTFIATTQVTVYATLAITDKPENKPTIEPGTTSDTYTATGGDDSQYTWIVTGPATVTESGTTGKTFTFTAPSTGNFAGVYTVEVTDSKNITSFDVKVPMKFDHPALAVKTTGTLDLTVLGADTTATNYTWKIIDEDGEVDKSEIISNDNTNSIDPDSSIDTVTTFYVRVTVEGDDDWPVGLNTITGGPYRFIPVKTYTVAVRDNDGAIDGSELTAGDITVAVFDPSMGQNVVENLISEEGTVIFDLPDTGGNYQYEITDTRTTPAYFTFTDSSNSMAPSFTLRMIGTDTITGTVENNATNATLNGATVTAFQPNDPTTQYEAVVASDVYAITLPDGAAQNGWSVVASNTNYVSHLLEYQAIGTVDFTGADDGLQEQTMITVVTTLVSGEVQLDITATQNAFTDAYQASFKLISGDGALSGSPTFTGVTISETYNAQEDFSVLITADTSDDDDPATGYAENFLFTYVYGTTGLINQGIVGANGGNTGLVNVNDQSANANVPTGGLSTEATILIRQTVKDNETTSTDGSPDYVYEINAVDNAGKKLTTDINRIEITLPIDLTVIAPGDLEKGIFTIYHASTQAALETGGGTPISVSNIINSNYFGDGVTGSVTFWVNSLSYFGVGSAVYSTSPNLVESSSDTRCFIATAAYGSPFETHVTMLREFRDMYLMPTSTGRNFVNVYYRLSPPMADFIAEHDSLQTAVRVALMPAIGMSYMLVNFGMFQTMLLFSVILSLACMLTFRLAFFTRKNSKTINFLRVLIFRSSQKQEYLKEKIYKI